MSNDVPSCGTCWWRIATAHVTRRSALLEQGGEDLLPGGEEIFRSNLFNHSDVQVYGKGGLNCMIFSTAQC